MLETSLPKCACGILLAAMLSLPQYQASAQQRRLTLQECRDLAVQNSRTLEQSRTELEMAGYDRKIAFANYFPNINATGAYLHNNRNLSLISDKGSTVLRNLGSAAQLAAAGSIQNAFGSVLSQIGNNAGGLLDAAVQNFQQMIASNPAAMAELAGSPLWQSVVQALGNADANALMQSLLSGVNMPSISGPVNELGKSIDDALHLDISNMYVGVISLQQPVFMGGKIVLSNQMARLAEELARSRYDAGYADIVVDVDKAYWQIVSISAKKKLAGNYSELLHQLEKDVEVSVKEGVATKSDALQIKVKANEADMMLTKAVNGLSLAKMLLCKQTGLPLDTPIVLADEDAGAISDPGQDSFKEMDKVFDDRPEIRSLSLASGIYDKKIGIARSEMLPKVLLTADFMVSNPNAFHGFDNGWNGGLFSAGVVVNIPLFHGTENLQKTRKAKAEARLYRSKLEDAKAMITLQVSQCRHNVQEARQKLSMSSGNLASAEENLRMATAGFEAGVIDTNTVLAAQTAWLKANTEQIEAGIDLRVAEAMLRRAEGEINAE